MKKEIKLTPEQRKNLLQSIRVTLKSMPKKERNTFLRFAYKDMLARREKAIKNLSIEVSNKILKLLEEKGECVVLHENGQILYLSANSITPKEYNSIADFVHTEEAKRINCNDIITAEIK